MRFRSPTDEPIRIALLSGHTAIVGPDWRELEPIFHRDAVANGCEREHAGAVPRTVAVQPSVAAAAKVESPEESYRRALTTMIQRDVEKDFTADSLPNINAVSKLCGFAARKEDVLRVFRQMKDEAEQPQDGSEPEGDA